MKKKFLITALLAFAVGAVGLTACNKTEPASTSEPTPATSSVDPVSSSEEPVIPHFTVEVRAFNGVDAMYNAKIDGTLLASKEVTINEADINVSDALARLAPAEEGAHKLYFNDTDYLLFTETTVGYSTSWFLSDGYLSAEPNYTAGDYSWSYMAYNGHYSNGVTVDFVDGLDTYTIVVDGYDGTTGQDPAW